jgi:predicted nucleic acid-binding protein
MREVTEGGMARADAREIAEAAFLEQVRVDPQPDPLLLAELGRGEAEVITLAHRTGAEFAIIDERRARRIAARSYGLRVRGTAGVLVAAKRAGLVTAIRPLLETMIRNGYFVSPTVVERACGEANE